MRLGSLDGRKAADPVQDAEASKAFGHRLPAVRSRIEVDAVDGIEMEERTLHLRANPRGDRRERLSTEVLGEVGFDRPGVEGKLVPADPVVPHAFAPVVVVRDTRGAVEAVVPTQKRKADRSSSGLAKLL